MRRRHEVRATAVGLAAVVMVLAGCSSSASNGGSATSTTRPDSTTKPAPPKVDWSASIQGETDVDGNYRQGLARSGDGWIFITNNAIYRTDRSFVELEFHKEAIPADLAAQGYNHLGDPDISDGLIWIPVEREDKSKAEQVTARYDEDTLEFVDSFTVPQHHNSFVAVSGDGTVYSTDEFDDDTIVRYRVAKGAVEVLPPLKMSQTVEQIQGGDLGRGAIWLSTDDDHNGVYRVDLQTGEVTDLGTAGHDDGEGEGIDASDMGYGLLHVLVADEAIAPMWVIDVKVASKPSS